MMSTARSKSKAEDFTGTWRNILRYIRRYRYVFVIAVILSAVSSVLALLGPYCISDMTDLIKEGIDGEMDIDGVKRLGLILLCIYLASGIVHFVQSFMMATVSQRSAQMFRRDIAAKFNRIPLNYFDRSSKGDIMSRVTNDVDTLGNSMNQCIGSVVSAATTMVGALILMLIMNLQLTALTIAVAAVGFAVVKIVAKRTQVYFKSQQRNLGAMNGLVEEQYSGHTAVTVYAGQREAMERFDRINDDLAHSAFRSQFLGGISAHLSGLISNTGYVLVCVTGAFLYMDGQISFGVIVAFMIFVKMFTGSFSQMSYAVVTMQTVAAAAERVFTFLGYDEIPPEEDNPSIGSIEGRVEFRDVCFGYEKGKEIIHGFSAEVEPGQKVAIVGPTGAGKTTLINLLMRFYDLDSGTITIDGIPITDMSRSQVRSLFGMVLQESWLFEGTLRENIVLNREDVTDERLDEVCGAVGLGHFVSSLPNGYDTMVKDDDSMSAGQRQQIAIARAMIGDPTMIILDEATSSVDPLTEKLIQKATDRMMEGRTSFVIAHRLSTIEDADLIIVVRDGRIAETGTHRSLLEQGGFYKKLFDSQFNVIGD